MVWLKYFIIAALFYFFAVLQNSFFVHFNILGITPNLVLVFYFLFIFFEKSNRALMGIFGAFVAGFLLDAFSHSPLGISIILLLALMFLTKKALQVLWEKNSEYSVVYFIVIFLLYLAAYYMLLNLTALFLNPAFANFAVSWPALIAGAYNLFFAVIGFYIFDKFAILSNENRQLKLFK